MNPSPCYRILCAALLALNQRRRHSALDYKSPVAFETQFMNN